MHVAVGVYKTRENTFLVCQRPKGKPWSGLWEFPGGKIELGEDPATALCREWREELAVTPTAFTLMSSIDYSYPKNKVCLHVFLITQLQGKITPLEQQKVSFKSEQELFSIDMLPANRFVLSRFMLSSYYYMTSESLWQHNNWEEKLAKIICSGIKQVRLRRDSFDKKSYSDLVRSCAKICHKNKALLFIDCAEPDLLQYADGVHLAVKDWSLLTARPCSENKWLGMSVHNSSELISAQQLGCDFVTISPVNHTTSHPEHAALGWEALKGLCTTTYMAVYALGGVSPADIRVARQHGAFGVAGISGFFNDCAQ